MGNPSAYLDLQTKDAIISKLDKLLQHIDETNYSYIAIFNLIEQTNVLNTEEKIAWLTKNTSYLPGPFLLLNATYISIKNPALAGKWYLLGRARMIADLDKCYNNDLSDGIQIVLMRFLPRLNIGEEKTEKSIFNYMLSIDTKMTRKLNKKYPYKVVAPYWIDNHGMNVFLAEAGNSPFVTKDKWQQIEQNALEEQIKYIEQRKN